MLPVFLICLTYIVLYVQHYCDLLRVCLDVVQGLIIGALNDIRI